MKERDIIQILNRKISTLELIIDEIYETLVSNGLIDDDKFNTSINEKITKINKLLDYKNSQSDDESINYSPLFYGPIGEA